MCAECGKTISGSAEICIDIIYHPECLRIKKLRDVGYTHECPMCEGTGRVSYQYNAYPSGLPDSGFVDDMRTAYKDCDLCEGRGYLKNKLPPELNGVFKDKYTYEVRDYMIKLDPPTKTYYLFEGYNGVQDKIRNSNLCDILWRELKRKDKKIEELNKDIEVFRNSFLRR
jgi:hypothetical protein